MRDTFAVLFALTIGAAHGPASAPVSAPVAPLPHYDSTGPVCVAEVDASINPGSGDFMIQSIQTAKAQACAVLIFTLDTPGGMLSTTRDIVKAILGAPLPVVVYVYPPGSVAGSAGVFITLSAHIAAMANGTNIGAAHPVSSGGDDVAEEAGKEMARKVENDAVAFIESIAIERGRNKEWAMKAVKESVSIPAQTALDAHVIDLIATDLDDLVEKLDGRAMKMSDHFVDLRTKGREVRKIHMSISQRFTNAVADPQIAYILMTFGMLGIVMELYHPGAIFPGVFGSICLLVAFVSMQVLPINWGGVALLLLGLALFVAELFVSSSGLLGVGGGVAVVLGGLLLINTQDPNYYVEPNFALGWSDVLPLGIAVTGIAMFIASVVMRTRARKPEAGKEALIAERAVVKEAIPVGGSGLVFLNGELWRASAAEHIDVDAQVVVERVDGLSVVVKRV